METFGFALQSAPGPAYEPGARQQRDYRQSEQELPEVMHEKTGGRIAERLEHINGNANGSQDAGPLGW
ncbi:MAG: hypothetical protein ACREUX_16210 [Burkholderiales bacterium]